MAQVYFVPAASATPLDRAGLRDAWIALLGRWEWEWFCTFTFRDLVHPEAADKRFRVLISQANRALFGTMWYKRNQGLRWVRALEYQKRDVIHYHALMAGVQDLRRLTWIPLLKQLHIALKKPLRMAQARRFIGMPIELRL
jgi:hypothetical protein